MGEKTAREVIENHSGGWLEGADGLIAALDAEGFVIVPKAALQPFANAYDMLERNNYVRGLDLIARQDGRILGHVGFGADELRAARDAFAAASTPTGEKG